MQYTLSCLQHANRIKCALKNSDAVLIGAGAGLSASAGFEYSGKRFQEIFNDFENKYGFHDMYTGGFYPFPSLEEFWAYWSRYIHANRYTKPPVPVYDILLNIVKDKEYFVLTTNVDHCFQRAGFDKNRLFYTQGDYGLFQCSVPCHEKTYDNEYVIRKMVTEQTDMKIPSRLIPYCPICGKPMTTNLRADDKFVQDKGWHKAYERYAAFTEQYKDKKLLLLELGVGANTPGIIKYPFWRTATLNPNAMYVCINNGDAMYPNEIKSRSVCVNEDIFKMLELVAN